jgi:hypothetical protein
MEKLITQASLRRSRMAVYGPSKAIPEIAAERTAIQ